MSSMNSRTGRSNRRRKIRSVLDQNAIPAVEIRHEEGPSVPEVPAPMMAVESDDDVIECSPRSFQEAMNARNNRRRLAANVNPVAENNQIVAVAENNQIVAIEENNQIVAVAEDNQIVAVEENNQIVAIEENNQIVAFENNQIVVFENNQIVAVPDNQIVAIAEVPNIALAEVPPELEATEEDIINWETSDKIFYIKPPPPSPPPTPPSPPKPPTPNCPICMAPFKEEMTTRCGHIFCKKCIRTAIHKNSKCPTCRKKVTMRELIRVFLPLAN